MPAQLLGTASGTTSVTITLTDPVPGAGTLHVAFCTYNSVHDSSQYPNSASDASGGDWKGDSNEYVAPVIGLARSDDSWHGNTDVILVGTVGRACTAGDLSAGDTVTVGWHSSAPATFQVSAMLVYVPAAFVAVYQGGPPTYYANSDGTDALGGGPASALSWETDWGWDSRVAPDDDACRITVLGSWPGLTGFTPVSGTVVGEYNGAETAVAFTVLNVGAGVVTEPGGSWPSPQTLLSGNYQYQEPMVDGAVAAAAGIYLDATVIS